METSKKYDPFEVHAGAEKRFFIDMLVKDIELLPAIADLVDNSVDGARGCAEDNDLSEHWIHLSTTGGKFTIADNSGGISVDIARNYAFRFGRPAAFKGTKGSVGQFGIGMKRAIFKLGSSFNISSTHRSQDENEDSEFSISVDVDEWAKSAEDWSFKFSTVKEQIELGSEEIAGTSITVDVLHPSVKDDLDDPSIINELKLELATRHQRSISSGLTIEINGDPLRANAPKLQYSDEVIPLNDVFPVPVGDGVVNVRILAGSVAPSTASEGEADDGIAQNFQNISPAGWYIFCNDRLLLAADKSSTTGWGTAAAAYHPQYRHFRGYVYMQADDASLLPWNTTKTAVDRDSPVFRAVLSRMKTALVDVQAVINREKTEKEKTADDAAPTPLVQAIAAARNVPIEEIPESPRMVSPAPTTFPKRAKADPKIQRIQYVVDAAQFASVAELFGTNSGSEVGRRTFDYVYQAEID